MRLSQSGIQTLREAPSNARTPGFAWLVRACCLSRDSEVLPLGQRVISNIESQIESGENPAEIFDRLTLPLIETGEGHFFFSIETGKTRVLQCPSCGYAARQDLARFKKEVAPREEEKPLEKVHTPNCHTIEALADFLKIPTQETAKAVLMTRPSDGKLIFAVVRGDMGLSEAKLKNQVGEVKTATHEEIEAAGASAGFAAPIGLTNALIVVDDLIPESSNLVTGANEDDHHLLNVNYGRDYTAEIVADLAEAAPGAPCPKCDGELEQLKADLVAEMQDRKTILHPTELLLALAESHHDENGLTLPPGGAPFDVYLVVIPGKELDTASAADELYSSLSAAGVSVLYDDRDTRAGVKFNDADLIGPPLRITVGERGLQAGMVETKFRTAREKEDVPLGDIVKFVLENLEG